MPVRMVFDHTRTHITSQFMRHMSCLTGVLMLVAGLLAAVASIPLGLVTVLHVVAYLQRGQSETLLTRLPISPTRDRVCRVPRNGVSRIALWPPRRARHSADRAVLRAVWLRRCPAGGDVRRRQHHLRHVAKTATVQHPPEISRTAEEISRQGQRIFAPRMVVVRVESLLWPATVSALARRAGAVIVDISEPTEHVLWELEEMARLHPGKYNLIGEEASIRRWSAGIVAQAAQSFWMRFANHLGEAEVLAYTIDKGGMRRFARAIHGRLRDLPTA